MEGVIDTDTTDSIEVTAVVKVKDTSVEFRGSAEAVLDSIHRFLINMVPNLDIASRITLNYSLTQLMKMFGEYIRITPEGPRVINESAKRISDKEVIALQLVASRILFELKRSDNPSLSAQEIQSMTALKQKSVSSRLSEMVKVGYVEKESTEHGVKYRITTQGIHWLNNSLTSKR